MDWNQTKARVVSIDLDDDEQIDELSTVFVHQPGTTTSALRATLETLLPKPKPEEPTGLGAVIRSAGTVFTRTRVPGRFAWESVNTGVTVPWSEMCDDVEILFAGVEL